MAVNTVVEDVLDGAITALTLEAREENAIMSCRFEISESGDTASLIDCNVFSDDTEVLEAAFSMIVATLKKNGVESVELHRVNVDEMLHLSLERWIS